MKRRTFLKIPIAAAACGAMARFVDAEPPVVEERAQNGVRVAAEKDRYLQELAIMGGRFDLKVSRRDTNGALCIYDTTRMSKGGPAQHLHHAQDEWFYVIRGEFLVQVGEDTFTLRPGDSAFAPRKIRHTFAMTSEGEGQMLVLFQPAGSMEDFFLQMSKMGKGIPDNQQRELKQLFEVHGMEVTGPPLKV